MGMRTIRCSFGVDYILRPCNLPPSNTTVDVYVSVQDSPLGDKTGTLQWSGMVQAFLTFDSTGTRVISYTLTNMSPAVQASVENIIASL